MYVTAQTASGAAVTVRLTGSAAHHDVTTDQVLFLGAVTDDMKCQGRRPRLPSAVTRKGVRSPARAELSATRPMLELRCLEGPARRQKADLQ